MRGRVRCHLVRDAGTPCIEQRADALRAEITAAGHTATTAPTLELALAFQHTVTGDNAQLEASAERLRALTAGGDYAYYLDIAASMADQEPTAWSGTAWLDSQDMVRTRWRRLVLDRRTTARRDGATR